MRICGGEASHHAVSKQGGCIARLHVDIVAAVERRFAVHWGNKRAGFRTSGFFLCSGGVSPRAPSLPSPELRCEAMTDETIEAPRDGAAAVAERLAKEAELDAAVARGEYKRVKRIRKKSEIMQSEYESGMGGDGDEGRCLTLTVRGQDPLSDEDEEVEEFEYIPLTPEERLEQENEARAAAYWSRGNDLLKR